MNTKIPEDNYLNLSKVGSKYTMYISWGINGNELMDSTNDILNILGIDAEDYLTITGTVIYTDGVVSIVRVENSYMELDSYLIYYEEVKQHFPNFTDPKRKSNTEYLCMDIENEKSLFYRDWDNGTLYEALFDENHLFIKYDGLEEMIDEVANGTIPDDLFDKVNDLKEELTSSSKWDEFRTRLLTFRYPQGNDLEKQEKIVKISLTKEDEKELEENGSMSEPLYSSISRTRQWMFNKDCATLTTWKGRKVRTRAEDDEANRELVNILRQKGYGVTKLRGCYVGTDKVLQKENSFLVVDLRDDPSSFFNTIYSLSEKYEQECFLYKERLSDIAYLIGTNDNFGKGKIVIAGKMHINSGRARNYSKISNARISFE